MNLQPLVIDDDNVICFLIKKLLKLSVYPEPKSFLSAVDALEYVKNEQNIKKTYVIFLDINMPNMNGWEFIEALESHAIKSNYFIYIITSSIDENDKHKSTTYSSVKKFISKPLKTIDLELLKESKDLKPFF